MNSLCVKSCREPAASVMHSLVTDSLHVIQVAGHNVAAPRRASFQRHPCRGGFQALLGAAVAPSQRASVAVTNAALHGASAERPGDLPDARSHLHSQVHRSTRGSPKKAIPSAAPVPAKRGMFSCSQRTPVRASRVTV